MKSTRFMRRLFAATAEEDEELTGQVAKDIEDAKAAGSVDTDEVRYEDEGDGRVSITDKENGEVTMAERGADGDYDLYPASQGELEGYIHPEMDGVTPGQMYGSGWEESVDSHMDGSSVYIPNVPGGGLNPEAGYERSVEDIAQMGPCDGGCDEEKEFSIATDNAVVQRIFSDQEFMESLFSEVIDSEETAKVGDLKIEKVDDDEVVVTSESTGDQAKVTLDGDDMEVQELETKDFSYYDADEDMIYYPRYYSEDEEDYDDEDDYEDDDDEYDGQYEALHVVGVDPDNHVIVDAPEYDEESAQELAQRLTEQGVVGVEIFADEDEARDHAIGLLSNLGAESADDVEEPVQAEFSDHTIYLTKFYSGDTELMTRMFSEAANGIDSTQSEIEDAIESGEEIENDDEVITPIDSETAVIEDKETGEFTKATLDGDEMDLQSITKAKYKELTQDLVKEDEDDDDQKEYSYYDGEIYTDDYGYKFFSEDEFMSDYMVRLFSDEAEADEKEIEDAIESGEQVETDDEVITPVDSETAIIEDKESGEFTKAVMDDDKLDLTPISQTEADHLTKDLAVEENDEDEDDQKEYSYYDDEDIISNDYGTKFFSENEYATNYMYRLFSDEADEKEIESAIESGEQVETDDEVITPVDSETAVIEDKESGEFTKAVMDDDKLDLNPISEAEADRLTGDLAVENNDNDEDEKNFSWATGGYYYNLGDPVMDRFFADVMQGQPMPQGQMDPAMAQQMAMQQGGMPQGQMPMDPNAMPPVDEYGNPIDPAMMGQAPAPTIETIEDKAIAAVQSIQAAAAEAEATIMNAKAAPAQQAEPDLQEAQFSYYGDYGYDYYDEPRYFTNTIDVDYEEVPNDTLVSWLDNNGVSYR